MIVVVYLLVDNSTSMIKINDSNTFEYSKFHSQFFFVLIKYLYKHEKA